MTRREEEQIKAFIADALTLRHLLRCVPHSDLSPEDREVCLVYRTFSNLCTSLAYRLRRQVWKEWEKQRQEERARKRAAKKRRQAEQKRKRDAQRKARQRTR